MPSYIPYNSNEQTIITSLIGSFERYCSAHGWTNSILQADEHALDSPAPDLHDLCCIALRAETLSRYDVDPRRIIGLFDTPVNHPTSENYQNIANLLLTGIQTLHNSQHSTIYDSYLFELYNFNVAINQQQISEDITETFMAYVDTVLLYAWDLNHLMLGQSGFIRRLRLLREEQNERNAQDNRDQEEPSNVTLAGRLNPTPIRRTVLNGEQQANVEAFQEDKPRLRKRSDKEGTNDLAHNLTVKYQHCIGLWTDPKTKQERPITISQFFKDKNQLNFIGREYREVTKEGDPTTKEVAGIYNEGDILLPKPLPGWIMDESGLYLLELVPGTYLRGVSTTNMTLRWMIDAEQIRAGLRLNWTRQLIFNIVRRPLISLEEGLKKKLQWFAITNNVAAVLREKHEKEKLFILMHDLCIGEYNFKNKRIKIYRYYEQTKHLLERTLKHECE